jgi:hypothetical protein
MTEHDALMDWLGAASVFVPTLIKKKAASPYHRVNVAIGTAPSVLNLQNIIRQHQFIYDSLEAHAA